MLSVRQDSPTIARERTRQRDREAARDRYIDLRSKHYSYDSRVEKARDEWEKLCEPMWTSSDPEPIKGSTDFQCIPVAHIDLPEPDDWLFEEGMPELDTDETFFLMTGKRVNWRGRHRG